VSKLKIIAISDVHEQWYNIKIPECDILISAGDYSYKGKPEVVMNFHRWLNEQEAGHIISVNGNHELFVEKNFQLCKEIAQKECPGVHFMDEGLIEIEGFKIYCSAITPWFHDWAWNVLRGDPIKRHWDRIPDDTDVLVTHGPPYGILDTVYHFDGITPRQLVGCEELYKRVWELPKLKCHIFGHIHGSYGHKEINGVKFYNASICDEAYSPSNEPWVIEI